MGGVRPPPDWLQQQQKALVKKALAINAFVIVTIELFIWWYR